MTIIQVMRDVTKRASSRFDPQSYDPDPYEVLNIKVRPGEWVLVFSWWFDFHTGVDFAPGYTLFRIARDYGRLSQCE